MHILAEIQLGMEESEITKSLLGTEQAAQLNSYLSFRQEEECLRLKSVVFGCNWVIKTLPFFTDNVKLVYLEIISLKFIL